MPNGDLVLGWPEVPSKANGIAYRQQKLLDAVTANDVGLWVPWYPFHKGSFEVDASSGTLTGTVALKFSNSAEMPANGFTVTVGGSVTTGDKMTVTLTSPEFSQGIITASYTAVAGDTVDTVAAGLAAALVAAISAELTSPIVPPYEPSDSIIQGTVTPEQQAAAGAIKVTNASSTAVIVIAWYTPIYTPALKSSVSAGATETLTDAQYDDGSGYTPAGCSVTSASLTTFDVPAMWIKSPLSGYNSSSDAVSCILYGVLP
jgi:hypothetical protein